MNSRKTDTRNGAEFTIENLAKSVYSRCGNHVPYEFGVSCKNYAGGVDKDGREVALRSPIMNTLCARCRNYADKTK